MEKEIRKSKLESLLVQEIGNLIVTKGIKDPRVHEFLTVARVEVSKDLINARVFICSIKEGASLDNAIKALNNAKGFIQREIVKRIRVRNTPKLNFLRDDTISKAFYVNKVIENLSFSEEK
ncbi:Ribosome-binding factor A [Borrelia miyamotoi]|uniref:Ribosome-binding factor A n=1 Tax=Borrelia miyamotoi TaxID=47466 RepID=A0AAP9CFE2_9SPIR|nr:30S ribosome-binding factor RbfA [Borrelia miyamotoi]ATQ15171.1 30S ribosome-binding factor RbfA [Borrelia miyamotoi]ATQ16353.1 30S ribosome-binding factor RbfA [Borrelia miyamotoi]ATQ17496.1 30S ribosome-binding factor RbfA [Borrelia miyamotoi]ATQ18788.1 30S ribosome-binding factor RbfA [Borrelia miyamotoi]ATQ19992.1 30S ribosome-binding factor RbfA [Borrelia miyamotoi]